MEKLKLILLLFLFSTGNFMNIYAQSLLLNPVGTRGEHYWYMVAQSTDIYCVDISILYAYGTDLNRIELNQYQDFLFPVSQTLKGRARDSIVASLYITEEKREYLISFVTNEVRDAVIFLFEAAGGRAGYYIVSPLEQSFLVYDSSITDDITEQVKFQREILLHKLYADFPVGETLQEHVCQLIEEMTIKEKEREAFEKLEKLGDPAVPYIILYMGNYKELPIKNMALKNTSSDAWEEYRHYAPYLVIDALGAILNQITKYSFNNNYNGKYTNDSERQRGLNAWRIYLYYLMRNKGSQDEQ